MAAKACSVSSGLKPPFVDRKNSNRTVTNDSLNISQYQSMYSTHADFPLHERSKSLIRHAITKRI